MSQDNSAQELSPEAQAFEVNREADEQRRQNEALEVTAKHRDATGADAPDAESAGTLANHRQQLEVLGNEVNEATNALLKFAEAGETIEEVAARGKRPGVNPAFTKAAHRAINAHTQMDQQQRAANQAQADINAKQDANDFSEARDLRKREIRALALRIAREEKLPMADAFTIAMIEIQTDGVENTLPMFSKTQQRLAEKYAAEEDES